ncbi:hypothetical protein llg_00220 [Luteolibacter sp. LG18]|nr:hypothetical protein llg_00220 [Luteolibacter sp. LG18]
MLLVAALGFGLVSSASAQTVVRLTGSTAFRSSVHQAILDLMPDEIYSYTGTAGLGSASQAIFKGTIAGNVVIIKTSWSGSAAGIRDVAQGNNVNFLADAVVTVPATPGYGTAGGTANVAAGTTAEVAQVAMSDVFQGSTIYTTPTLTDNKVAAVPFKWIANDGAPAALTNVAPGVIQKTFFNGGLPLAVFTGNSADQGVTVYPVGRDPESGTRITAMAESGLGAFATVIQYDATVASDEVTDLQPWAATGAPTNYVAGNNGYSSGGTLRDKLGAKSTNFGVLLGYLGLTDSATAITNGAKELSWNGVPYSATNVYEGRYTFWGYQHLFYKNTLTGVPLTTATALKNQIIAVPGSAGLLLSNMHVSRAYDGAPIDPEY